MSNVLYLHTLKVSFSHFRFYRIMLNTKLLMALTVYITAIFMSNLL